MTTPRVFGVDYQFLSCGDVFTRGLVHAAEDLGVEYQHAPWDVSDLPARVRSFAPDLLLVVHGRRFQQWGPRVTAPTSAVWLLDDPYEVDDTAAWSARFDRVFVNDPSTLHRHAHASYLPTCYDPHVHAPGNEPRLRAVGFIGGANPTRDRYLAALARNGLLTYVVGGPFGDASVQAKCLARTIVPRDTAALYQQTRIVINVFRERHHWNRDNLRATSLNPRVYEALACGALVVSESRAEVASLVPELPTFGSVEECVSIVTALLGDPNAAEAIRVRCMERLAPHTYAARLQTVLDVACAEVAA